MNTEMMQIFETMQANIFEVLAEAVVKDHSEIFKGKMTAAKLLEIFTEVTSKKSADEDDVAEEEEEAEYPEGWDEKSIAALKKKMASLSKGKWLNVVSNREKGDTKGCVFDKNRHICAPKDKQTEFEALIAYLDKEDNADEEEDNADDDEDDADEEGDDEEEEKSAEVVEKKTYIEGYDEKKLKKLKSKIEDVEEGSYINVKTTNPIKDTLTNRKKYEMLDEEKVAVEKLDDAKKMKKYLDAIRKMLE